MNIENNKSGNLEQSAINEDLLWIKIEHELNKKKKNRNILFFMLAIASFILTLSLIKVGVSMSGFLTNDSKTLALKNTKISDVKYSPAKTFASDNDKLKECDNLPTGIKIHDPKGNKGLALLKSEKNVLLDNNFFDKSLTTKVDFTNGRIFDVSELNPQLINGSLSVTNVERLPTLIVRYVNSTELKSSKPGNDLIVHPTSFALKKSSSNILFSCGIGSFKIKNFYDGNLEWHNLKNQGEQPLFVSHLKLHYQKYFLNNLYLFSGLEYSKFYSKFIASSSNIVETPFESDSAQFINIDNQNYYFNGVKVQSKITTDYYKVYNHFSAVEIPFGLGYDIKMKKNVLSISANTSFRFLSMVSGYTYDNNLKIKKYSEIKDQIKFHYGLSNVNIQLKYRYAISDKLSACIGLEKTFPLINQFSYNSHGNTDFYSKYESLFLNIGIGYQITN